MVEGLGAEGYVLRVTTLGGRPVVVAAGATDRGTRHAIYEFIRQVDVSGGRPLLPTRLGIRQKPSFELRGVYAHQHWAYNYPYALRTWSVEEWKLYVDLLAYLDVNLLQIWSMAGILPVPLSKDDEEFLRRYPPVIEHAQKNHAMEVWIGECANNVCAKGNVPPVAERLYFDVEMLKNPGDPQQLAELTKARSAFYEICNNADGYWVIDSDPGGWEGSPAEEFVSILSENRKLIDRHARLGKKAKLIYWMWVGWGTGPREDNWQRTIEQMRQRIPEPWWITVSWDGHWQVADEAGVTPKAIYYPYGAVEPEPSLPFTTVVPKAVIDALDVEDRVATVQGAMANAQTPLCQLPNLYFFTRAIWDMALRREDRKASMHQLARLIYPQRADVLTAAWMSLGHPDAPKAEDLAEELNRLCDQEQLGRPGPVGLKLFPDYSLVARDLARQLRIHAAAVAFCRSAGSAAPDAEALARLERYCLLSLEWRRRTGFRRFGTNGYDFFPLHDAAHRRWWRGDHLDREVYRKLERSMKSRYDDWEAELILYPLNH